MLVAVDYDSAKAKGVENLLLQHDEDGFFERVILISPYMRRDRTIAMSPRHEFREYGTGAGAWRRLLAPVHFVRLVAACLRLVRAERIDVIRATEPTLCGLAAWLVSRLTGVPYVLSLHADYDKLYALDGPRGAPTLFGSRTLIWPIERLTIGGAARVMPIRDSLVPYALARGARPESIRVIPHGIDFATATQVSAVDVRATFDIPADRAIVAFAGRLSPENYVTDMLDAMRLLAARRDDFMLVLAGGGVLDGEVAARLRSDGLLARVVKATGFVPRDTVQALRAAAAVSLCLMGGFSLIEACAAGRPVIAYDVDWHHELAIDGVTGRLLREGDVAGVADAVADVLDHPADAARMGAAARQLASERHDQRRATDLRRRCYTEVLG